MIAAGPKICRRPCLISPRLIHSQKQQQQRLLYQKVRAGSGSPVVRGISRRKTASIQFSSTMTSDELRFRNPVILICDLQDKFRPAIHEFDSVVLTTEKLITFATSLSIPIYSTTQQSSKLGPLVPSLSALLPPSSPIIDKTRFSMCVPALLNLLPPTGEIALAGIESHICITQTALDLARLGHRVYVLADATSSCNRGEVPVALDRLRGEEGVTVTTSESWMYECVGDAAHPAFKGLIGTVKKHMEDTKKVVEVLPPQPKM